MAYTKPILAAGFMGLGTALVLTAIAIQRDQFTFTSLERRNSDVFALTPVAPISPPDAAAEPVLTEEAATVAIEGLEVMPDTTPAPKLRRPEAAIENIEPAALPCDPQWRELESGPKGRRVRGLC